MVPALGGKRTKHILSLSKMQKPKHTREYRIVSEPRLQAFKALLNYCAIEGRKCSLIDNFATSRKGRLDREQFLQAENLSLIKIELVKAWPGTRVCDAVPLWSLMFDDCLRDLLIKQSRGLYGLQAPKLPEDLAIYREDGSLLLGTVAHEHLSWMNLTDKEASDELLGLVELTPARR